MSMTWNKKLKLFTSVLIAIVLIYCLLFIGKIDKNWLSSTESKSTRKHYSYLKYTRDQVDDFQANMSTQTNQSSNITNNQCKPPKILCLILTTFKEFKNRALTTQAIWAHKCDQTIYVTASKKPNQDYSHSDLVSPIDMHQKITLNLVHLNEYKEENYDKLTQKVLEALKYVHENQSKNVIDFDWLLKADDDTFVIVENLRHFLFDKCRTSLKTYGYTRKGVQINGMLVAETGFHVGGAGYLISRKALEVLGSNLVKNQKFCPILTGNEDLDVADCLSKLNVLPGDSRDESQRERFHSENYDNHWEIKYKSMESESIYGPLKKVKVLFIYAHLVYYLFELYFNFVK